MTPALAPARLPDWLAAMLMSLTASAATAQSPAPATSPAPAPDPASAISERVRRDADRPYHWIRVHAQKAAAPASAPAPAPTPAPPSAPAAHRAPASPLPAAAAAPAAASSGAGGRLTASAVQTLLGDLPPAAGHAATPGALSTPAGPVGRVEPVSLVRPVTPPELPEGPGPAPADPAAAQALESPGDTAHQPLALIHQVEPDFPPQLIERLRKGGVLVHVDVSPEGAVTAATVVRSTHSRLETAALDAVKAWRFAPPGAGREVLIDLKFNLDP